MTSDTRRARERRRSLEAAAARILQVADDAPRSPPPGVLGRRRDDARRADRAATSTRGRRRIRTPKSAQTLLPGRCARQARVTRPPARLAARTIAALHLGSPRHALLLHCRPLLPAPWTMVDGIGPIMRTDRDRRRRRRMGMDMGNMHGHGQHGHGHWGPARRAGRTRRRLQDPRRWPHPSRRGREDEARPRLPLSRHRLSHNDGAPRPASLDRRRRSLKSRCGSLHAVGHNAVTKLAGDPVFPERVAAHSLATALHAAAPRPARRAGPRIAASCGRDGRGRRS